MKQISAPELAALLQSGTPPLVLDVREPWEVALANLPGSVHIEMNEIPERHGELPQDQTIICVCHHGMRSMQVGLFLEHAGHTDIVNLQGGIAAWARDVDPSCPSY
ncbi:MAG: rhodanese-like domain-containing protein [Burkholderiaceae bacterium]